MDDLYTYFSSLNFAPHGHCYLWRTDLVMLHAGSDILIALSYYSIPIALFLIWKKNKDFQYHWMLILFAIFIFACGTTHIIDTWNIWHSEYYLEGLVKVITAIVSVATAILIWPSLPKMLSIPSPVLLAEHNHALKEEMVRREMAEKELRVLYNSLEHKVAERTRELKEATEALERQFGVASHTKQRLQSIFESAPSGMIVIDDSGEILQANELAHGIFRYPPGKLVGDRIESLVPEELRQHHKKDRARYIQNPEKRLMGERKDLYGVCHDGSRVPVEIGLNPVTGNSGKEIVASIVDISDRKEYERRIESRNEALERSNRELQEFAFIASHDLREPLRKIISFTKLLKSKDYGQLTEEGDEFAGYVVNAAERMRELLESLLSYSRVSSKGMDFTRVDLDMVLDEVQADLELTISETGAQFNISPLITIDADASQIRQLFQNMIANSLKYRAEERPVVIDISGTRISEDRYQLCFKDNGIGFEQAHADKIFEVFRRLHGRDKYSGTGMGLAICRKIVERHDGEIWAEGRARIGATFYVELPVKKREVVNGF